MPCVTMQNEWKIPNFLILMIQDFTRCYDKTSIRLTNKDPEWLNWPGYVSFVF